jgi:protein-S-isoprenylcysteine O-methyltransferase Ste14
MPLIPLFLLVSWGACWYFFLFRYAKGPFISARFSRQFALTTYGVFWLLILWSFLMWSVPPRFVSAQVVFVAVACVLAGQWLMCAARKALPLSNKDVVLGIATQKVSTGPYRYMSHPMYAGLLLALFGSSLLFFNPAALLLLLPIAAAVSLRTLVE